MIAVPSMPQQLLPLSPAQMTHVAFFPRSGIPHEGEGDRKGRAFPDLAVHADGTPMTLDDLRRDVQPHTQTGDRSVLGTRGPVEPLKNPVALLSRDAQAMIAHTDGDRLRGSGEIHFDGLGVRRILDGIAEQVGKDLSQPISIPDQAGLHRAMQQDAMTGVGLLHDLGDLPQQGVQIHRLPDVLQSARLDLGDIQQLFHQPGDGGDLGLYAGKSWSSSLHALLGQLPVQHGGLQFQDRERAPQFMAGRPDKDILALFEFLAGRIIQHEGDNLARAVLEEDTSH
jgi:hypothetical protein